MSNKYFFSSQRPDKVKSFSDESQDLDSFLRSISKNVYVISTQSIGVNHYMTIVGLNPSGVGLGMVTYHM